MADDRKQQCLECIPSMTELLKTDVVKDWLTRHPHPLVTEALRQSVSHVRQAMLANPVDASAASAESVLASAGKWLVQATAPQLRHAINATGIILHTGLGRAVFPEAVVDSMLPELKGYSTLAIDRETGDRIERDELIEPILCELTGAEAATVVNNNAAATLLVLAALAADREVIVSRGQLIEIGGSFRLPEVMAQSGVRLVEVGATNRTHLKDYDKAITPATAALMRVHPSNYRVVGFTSEVEVRDMAALAHQRQLICIDDLGAGALVDLRQFGLPHEPTVKESIQAGADVALFSGDKLIGASQAGIIVGRKDLINKLRKHPLMRALRVDKTCLMALERTLHLFRDPERLRRKHPTYRMLSTPLSELEARAQQLMAQITVTGVPIEMKTVASLSYLGSGTLPTESIPSVGVTVRLAERTAAELARHLRMDEACVFGRIEDDLVHLDMRTITDAQVPMIVAALVRAAKPK